MLRRSNRVRGIAPPDPESPTVDNRMLRNAGDRMVDPPTPSPHEVVDLLSSPESQDGSDSVRIVDPPTPPPHEVIDHVSSPESQNGSYTPNVHSDDETRMQPLSQDDIIGNGTSSVVCVDCTP